MNNMFFISKVNYVIIDSLLTNEKWRDFGGLTLNRVSSDLLEFLEAPGKIIIILSSLFQKNHYNKLLIN